MDEHAIRKMLEGGGGAAGAALRAVLWLPGRLYGGAMRLRRAAYRHGLLSSCHPGVPVISVGNLTAGGSGKTPMTILLARLLAGMGRRPGILLRGYRAGADGTSDEAALYLRQCPEAIVATGPDRRITARKAIAAGADILLLDDGLQHLRLRRDMDIVLVDASSPWGGGNTLPGGLLREPKSALREARLAVVTRADQVPGEALTRICAEVRRLAPQAAVMTARHAPRSLQALDGTELPLERLRGKKVIALCGIARPEAFVHTLETLGAEVTETSALRDHGEIDKMSLEQVLAAARAGAAAVVITEKDRVKQIFAELADNTYRENLPEVWTLGVEQAADDEAGLRLLLEEVCGAGRYAGGGAGQAAEF